MQLTPFRLTLVLLAGLFPASSHACTLALGSGGSLDLSIDGTILGSGEGNGGPASITLITGLFDDVTVSAPSLAGAPVDYQQGGQLLEVAYQSAGVLANVVQPYTHQATQFRPGLLPLWVLRIDTRIVNQGGFAAGTYTSRVMVTCS